MTIHESQIDNSQQANDGCWKAGLAFFCLTVGSVVAALLWAGAEFRYLDPWVGTTTDAAETLDKEVSQATAWVVWGLTLLGCACALRRGAGAAIFLAVGLAVTLPSIVHRQQVAAELSELVAPHTRWLRDANTTLDDVGLPEGYKIEWHYESLVGSADSPARWETRHELELVSGNGNSGSIAAFVAEIPHRLGACNDSGRSSERSYELSEDQLLVISQSSDTDRVSLSIVRPEATDLWDGDCTK